MSWERFKPKVYSFYSNTFCGEQQKECCCCCSVWREDPKRVAATYGLSSRNTWEKLIPLVLLEHSHIKLHSYDLEATPKDDCSSRSILWCVGAMSQSFKFGLAWSVWMNRNTPPSAGGTIHARANYLVTWKLYADDFSSRFIIWCVGAMSHSVF